MKYPIAQAWDYVMAIHSIKPDFEPALPPRKEEVAKVPCPYDLMNARFLSLSKSATFELWFVLKSSESNSMTLLPKSCDLSGQAVITTESKVTIVSTCDKGQEGTNKQSRIVLPRNIQLLESRLEEIEDEQEPDR